MHPIIAKRILTLITIASIPCAIYPVWVSLNIYDAVTNSKPIIPFDTATYYFLLASIFWVMAGIDYCGLAKNDSDNVNLPSSAPNLEGAHPLKTKLSHCNTCEWIRHHGGRLLISWFLSCLLLGILGGWLVPTWLTHNGYSQCVNPDSIARVSRGESAIFTLSKCIDLTGQSLKLADKNEIRMALKNKNKHLKYRLSHTGGV